jgi:hypothetical protein
MKRRVEGRFALVVLIGLVGGCTPTMDIEAIKQMKPARPAEMERLAAFIGHWETSAETKMVCLNQVLPTKGVTDNSWEGDGWYLVERGEYEMGELGTVHEFGVWTWDSAAKTFRTMRFDSFGGTRTGTGTFDEKSRTWTVKARLRSPWGSSVDRGTIKIVDDHTLEWTWREWPAWDVLRLFPVAEFRGTSKRK